MSKRWKAALLLLSLLTITNQASAWSAGASAEIATPFVQGDSVMTLAGSFTYPLSKKYSLALGQGVEKNFYYDADTSEFEFADTVLSFNVYPRSLIPQIGWTIRILATLPMSHFSRINEVYSKPEARWTATYPVTETISLGLNAFMRLTLSRYETTKPQDGTGAEPLPQFAIGIGHSGNWQLLPEWTLSYGLNHIETQYQQVTYEGSGDPAIYVLPDQTFTVFASINWMLTPEDSLSATYSYGSILLQPGIDDYVLYDQEESRWGVGYNRSFE